MAPADRMDRPLVDFLREDIALPPFHAWLKPELVSADETTGVVLRLPYRREFSRAPDRDEVHGGIIGALIDIAGHAAVCAALRRPVPTIDLRIDYLRLAGAAPLSATARARRLGRTIGIVDIEIEDDAARLVAIGRGSFLTASRD